MLQNASQLLQTFPNSSKSFRAHRNCSKRFKMLTNGPNMQAYAGVRMLSAGVRRLSAGCPQ
eukprot:11203140-Lingulodinium_polyedra.AAC.1